MCEICAQFSPFQEDGSCIYETLDAAASTDTGYTLGVGETFVGRLESAVDSDWVALSVVAGESYSLRIVGDTLASPELALFDPAGRAFTAEDGVRAETSLNRALTFTAAETGTYFIAASGDSGPGRYWLSADAGTPATAENEGASVYLNIDNMDVRLHGSMDDEPFANRTTAESLRNAIDAATADTEEVHTQGSHVWINSAPLQLEFDLRVEYDLTDLHFWNYHTETYDVDSIEFVFRDADRNVVGTLSFQPDLGVGNTQRAQDYGLDFPGRVQFVSATLTGTNGQVDFNNIGFTGTIGAEDPGGVNRISGTAGRDRLIGTDFRDRIEGGGSHDRLAGGHGKDTLIGGRGRDTLDGGSGDDILRGGSGDDKLRGGFGDDTLLGGTGDDTADYGDATGDVKVNLSRTDAQSTGVMGRDRLVSIENLVGSDYDDKLTGSGDANRIKGGDGADRINGAGGKDSLEGGSGNDVVRGGAGNDNLWGNVGNDVLEGGTGADTLTGGEGDDTLTGGAGRDYFRFKRGQDGWDIITDFDPSQDTLGFIGLVEDLDELKALAVDGLTGIEIILDQDTKIILDGITDVDQLTLDNVLIDNS